MRTAHAAAANVCYQRTLRYHVAATVPLWPPWLFAWDVVVDCCNCSKFPWRLAAWPGQAQTAKRQCCVDPESCSHLGYSCGNSASAPCLYLASLQIPVSRSILEVKPSPYCTCIHCALLETLNLESRRRQPLEESFVYRVYSLVARSDTKSTCGCYRCCSLLGG